MGGFAPNATEHTNSRIRIGFILMANVRVDAPAVASLNSTRDVFAGCISRLAVPLGFSGEVVEVVNPVIKINRFNLIGQQ